MKWLWRTIRESLNNTAIKIIVAVMAALGGSETIVNNIPQ